MLVLDNGHPCLLNAMASASKLQFLYSSACNHHQAHGFILSFACSGMLTLESESALVALAHQAVRSYSFCLYLDFRVNVQSQPWQVRQ
jgi:hypothetical protein